MTKPHDENISHPAPATRPEVPGNSANQPRMKQPNPSSAPVTKKESAASTPQKKAKPAKVKGSAAGAMWAGLIISALLLIILLVFILQNQQPAELNFFAWSWNFPIGIGMLFAAILGALITAVVGGLRMFDLRRQVKRAGLDK